eukprot:3143996-Pleurochrysis_carterae.AAC.1
MPRLQRYHSAHAPRAFQVLGRVLCCRSLCFRILELQGADANGGLVADGKLHAGHFHHKAVDVPRLVGSLANALDNLV